MPPHRTYTQLLIAMLLVGSGAGCVLARPPEARRACAAYAVAPAQGEADEEAWSLKQAMLVRRMSNDEVERFVVADVSEGMDLKNERERLAVEQESARIMSMVKPVMRAAESADGLWLYNTADSDGYGQSGFVALRGCEAVAIVLVWYLN